MLVWGQTLKIWLPINMQCSVYAVVVRFVRIVMVRLRLASWLCRHRKSAKMNSGMQHASLVPNARNCLSVFAIVTKMEQSTVNGITPS